MKRLIALLLASAVIGLVVFAGTASAATLTVTMPCGCKPLHDFGGGNESNATQTVSDSVLGTPAAENPSGTAGQADQSNGLGLTGEGLIYPSGSASFTP